jgi:acetyl-CoA C-acetyltransferase
MRAAVVTHAVRTPIGKFLGAFSELSAVELGVRAVRGLLERAGLPPERVEEAIFGNARQAGGGPNPARQVAVKSGLPHTVPAFTVNMACASGLKSLALAAADVQSGAVEIAVAGGTESMTRLPFLLDRFRTGYRLGHAEVADGMYRDGFLDPLCGKLMGETAETLAGLHAIPRDEQDRFALESQRRADAARQAGRFRDEIVPVEVPGRGGPVRVAEDEHPRPDTTLESLGRLPPVFRKDGSVTAGNSSGITDGAAALLVMSEERARALGLEPLARIEAWTEVGVDPAIMGIGPVPATRRLFERTGLGLADLDLIELNEAFAAQVLACLRELPFPADRLNVNGGSIALGHPIGCTGARIVVTLLHELRRRGLRRGLATLCVSGGLGMSMTFTRA